MGFASLVSNATTLRRITARFQADCRNWATAPAIWDGWFRIPGGSRRIRSPSPRPARGVTARWAVSKPRIWARVDHSAWFQCFVNSLPQSFGGEWVLERDDRRRISARPELGFKGARHVNNFEVWIIQFEKFRQFPTRSMGKSHFGQQQIYLCRVSCGGPDGFLGTRGLYDSILARESAAFQSTQNWIGFGDQDRVGMPVEQAEHALHNLFQNTGPPFGVSPCLYPPCAPGGPF